MYWTEFLAVALIHLLAVASPGPDFAIVVRESVAHGRRAGIFSAIGVGCGIFIHVAYSLLGIGLIVSQSIVLFNALKWLAAAYLLYIGIKALRAKPARPDEAELSLGEGVRSPRAAFVAGFSASTLNGLLNAVYGKHTKGYRNVMLHHYLGNTFGTFTGYIFKMWRTTADNCTQCNNAVIFFTGSIFCLYVFDGGIKIWHIGSFKGLRVQ